MNMKFHSICSSQQTYYISTLNFWFQVIQVFQVFNYNVSPRQNNKTSGWKSTNAPSLVAALNPSETYATKMSTSSTQHRWNYLPTSLEPISTPSMRCWNPVALEAVGFFRMLSLKCYIARVQTCPNISSLPTRRSLQQKGTKPFYPSSTLLTISEPKTFSNHPTFEPHHTPPPPPKKNHLRNRVASVRLAQVAWAWCLNVEVLGWSTPGFGKTGPCLPLGWKPSKQKKSTVRMVHVF